MDPASLYLAVAEKKLEDCIRPEMRAEWEQPRSNYCTDYFTTDAVGNFFPRICYEKRKKFVKREPGLPKEDFRCSELLFFFY